MARPVPIRPSEPVTQGQFGQLEKRMEEGFDHIDGKIEGLGGKVSELATNVGALLTKREQGRILGPRGESMFRTLMHYLLPVAMSAGGGFLIAHLAHL